MIKAAIITRGSSKIGMGHVSRCITLAEEIRNQADVTFLPNRDAAVTNYIKDCGFSVRHCRHQDELKGLLKQLNPGLVIVDKLEVEEDLARTLKEDFKTKLVIFGNLTEANKYADIVVNDIFGQFKDFRIRNLEYLDKNTNTCYFWGPRYVVLRKEFFELKQRGKRLPEEINKVVLTFGGSDPSNLTSLVLNELCKSKRGYKITIVLGLKFGAVDKLMRIINLYPDQQRNLTILKNVGNLGELMYLNDLVICSVGTTLFEALCVGTPVIGINQNPLQKKWSQGLMTLLDKNQVGLTVDVIDNAQYISPDSAMVRQMEIGEGLPDLIKTMLAG